MLFFPMARSKRAISNQGIYHVYNRAELGQPIFASDGAKHIFLQVLADVSLALGWELHAYAIMTNHFHFAVTTPRGDLDIGMHALLSGFSNKHKAFRGSIGHVFQSRYRADHYPAGPLAAQKIDYIHLNPVRAGITTLEGLKDYPWTSYRLMWSPRHRGLLTIGSILTGLLALKDDRSGWEAYQERLRIDLVSDARPLRDEELFGLTKKTKAGSLREASGLAKRIGKTRESLTKERNAQLEQYLQAELTALGTTLEELEQLPKSAEIKVRLARAIKARSLASSAWLAKALHLGTASNVRKLLR